MKTSLIIILSLSAILISTPLHSQAARPPAGDPKDFTLPEISTFMLDNGLSVTMIPYGQVPKVTASLIVRAGNLNEAQNELWLADLTGRLLKEGTTSLSGREIAEHAASMGGSIGVNVSEESTTISGSVLSEFGPDLISLLADIVMNPVFPDSEAERIRNDMKRDLSIQRSMPGSIAFELYRKTIYGNHPFGRIFPQPEDIDSYTIEKVRAFYTGNFGALRTHLYIAGKFSQADVEEKIRAVLDGWKGGPEVLISVPKPVSTRKILFADRPGAPQSVLNIGLPVVNPSDSDYIALVVTNNLLGGSFTSRITKNIRENKGYTYSPRSTISARYRDADWMQYAEVGTETTAPALKEIYFEINRLRNEPVPAEELDGIKNYTAGIFVLRNSSPEGIIGQMAFLDLHGLPRSFLTNYVTKVRSLTPDDIQRVMKTYIDPERMLIVVAGDRKKTEKELESYGPVTENR